MSWEAHRPQVRSQRHHPLAHAITWGGGAQGWAPLTVSPALRVCSCSSPELVPWAGCLGQREDSSSAPATLPTASTCFEGWRSGGT